MSRWDQRRTDPPRGPGRPGQAPLRPQRSTGGGATGELTRLPLPRDVRDAVLARWREKAPVHPGLWITRFVRWAEHPDDPERWDFEDRKRDNIEAAARAAGSQCILELTREWRKRRQAWLEPLEKDGLARRFSARTDWRLAIGLAAASPLETGITLHHLYGVPVLPGSGLKGLALVATRLAAKAGETSVEEYKEMFGTQQAAGLVDVLDGIPVPTNDRSLLEVDVMNPHYPLWYRREKGVPPSDDQSPNPVFFLTVPAGVQFEFALLCRTRTDRARSALRQGEKWLRQGLQNLGAGAKTSSGYGYFA